MFKTRSIVVRDFIDVYRDIVIIYDIGGIVFRQIRELLSQSASGEAYIEIGSYKTLYKELSIKYIAFITVLIKNYQFYYAIHEFTIMHNLMHGLRMRS